MKKILYILLLLSLSFSFAQKKEQRIQSIKNQLEVLSTEIVGLTENVKTQINVTNVTLANFLLAVSEIHKVNINVSPELDQISIVNKFTNVTVADLLVFLCKEYDLTIDFTGNILSVKYHQAEVGVPEKRVVPIVYNPDSNTISIDAKGDSLYDVFKRIMDESGKNLVFSPGLENRPLTAYIQQAPFDTAMDNLAFANNMYVEMSKDKFYVFKNNTPAVDGKANTQASRQRPIRQQNTNFFFKVKNAEQQLLEVDFVNTPIADVVHDIGNALNIDMFVATPLNEAGVATFKAKRISFDELLVKLFEIQAVSVQPDPEKPDDSSPSPNNFPTSDFTPPTAPEHSMGNQGFTFKKEGSVYYFGTETQLSVRKVAIIHLQHRSVQLLTDPSGNYRSRTNNFGNNFGGNYNYNNSNSTNYGFNNNQFDNFSNNRNRQPINTNSSDSFKNHESKAEALVNILPNEIKQDLDIKVDYELNSFYVNGPSAKVERFKKFIAKIDKPVPVVLIEVMLIEINKNATVETGFSWGLGEQPATTQGNIFPQTDLTLGAQTVNRVIGGFDGFGAFNLGKVVPNFFATIKAMESNGILRVRSTPKLSTLNGHRATFSNGQTSYYAVTQRNIYGTDNPQTSEITNYRPINAELGLTIKPVVSGDGQVTLDIFVIQSSFGTRIAENAPPDITSREFSSIIRVRDQDIVVLGGLEEQTRNNTGTGVPFLSRVPIIKWLFSSRRKEGRKARLTVLIKPTIIY